MEKLIELLNEYEGKPSWYEHRGSIWFELDEVTYDDYIITKKFGFIEWLVENKKIDRNLVDGAILYKTHRLFEDDYGVENMNKQYYEKTLMLLSISDTPIDDLISYLK